MDQVLTILTLIVALVTLGVVLWLARRGGGGADSASEQLDRVQQSLTQGFQSAAVDLAERTERVRADLRQDLTDRVGTGFEQMRAGIEQHLVAAREEQSRRTGETVQRLETKFDALTERQTRGLAEARQELTTTLGQATKTLEERFAALETRTTASLESIRGKVDERLATIATQVQQKLDQNIKEGFAQFEKVQTHLKAAEEQLRSVGVLGASINDLNNLLKLPHLRGQFGEATLERLLADFLPAGLYELQTAAGEGGSGRPDAIIHFPERTLPIDSKFPREQVLPLFESSDPQELAEARRQLERVIKEQGKRIAAYIRPEAGTTDVALMFLPSETLWFEVIQNRALSEALHELRVFPVSPNTLLVTLHAIAQTHKWYQVAKGFEATARELEKARKSFEHFLERFEDVGRELEKADKAYHVAAGHLNRYQSRVVRLTGDGGDLDRLKHADAPATGMLPGTEAASDAPGL